ncbi:lupus la ribonucleoprotein [Tritrichomonas foetus]|uniref:Lupus la ribonucleoprotein n=1 Tax=Tritrichomonas foetus TaxID=1144522 RepID=A0A1J4K3R7_9EUKA|nr:lupus la ribonucleoprotein [Tritrichomonas foetus]|eukprot:OHT06023.1 lupus la ribonucleoprotein [Tritrichomonas foetus]
MNLEKDAKFRDEIDKSGDRSVPFEFILECPRIKLLETTTDDICEAATNSEYLELALDENNQPKGVRSKVPFVSDPHRSERILKISGIGKTVPQDKRLEFFRSLFNAEDGIEVVSVHVVRKEIDGQIVNTDTSIVEFSTVEGAEAVIEQGIQYGNKLLEIQRQFKPKNKENSSQKSTPKGKRGKGRNSKPKTSE